MNYFMESKFFVKTDVEGINFVADRENGKWVITNKFDEKVKESLSGSFSSKPFSMVEMVALNMGRECNFDCVYCLVRDLKENTKQLTEEVGLKILEELSELPLKDRKLVFHGSEPMMNYKLIQKLVLESKRMDFNIEFCMQSNGSLFSEKNLDFLIENGIGIGISCDGLKIHQDLSRPYKGGFTNYRIVKENLSKIQKRQKKLSVITVVTKYNVMDLERITQDFEKKGIESVSFSPVNPIKDPFIAPSQKDLIGNVKKVCDRYLDLTLNGKNPIKIQNLRNWLGVFFNPKTTSNCLQCGAGSKHPLLAIDIDGSIYPCDYLWENKEYRIGNIFEMSLKDSMNSKKNFRVYRDVGNIEECNVCNWKRFCGGGCPGGSISIGRGLEVKSLNCEYNHAMLDYVAKKIPLIHSERLVREILER